MQNSKVKQQAEDLDTIGDNVLTVVEQCDFENVEISTKIQWLMDMFAENPDKKIIVFGTWYVYYKV